MARAAGARSAACPASVAATAARAADPRELAPVSDPAPSGATWPWCAAPGRWCSSPSSSARIRHHQRWDGAYLAVVILLLVAELRPLVKSDKRDPGGLTTSEAFVFALLLHWGLSLALLAMVVAIVIADAVRGRRPWRTAFNIAQYALAYGAASLVLIACSVDIARPRRRRASAPTTCRPSPRRPSRSSWSTTCSWPAPSRATSASR